MNIDAFPLSWPAGYERSKNRETARFKAHSFSKSRSGLMHELDLMNAKHVIISSNLKLRLDGIPYSGLAQPSDPGIAVYFTLRDAQRVFACDKWTRTEDNMHAIELAVSAIRGLGRWGVSQMMDRVFTGFAALPAPNERKWFEILDCEPNTPLHLVEMIYREYAKHTHPDNGGSHQKMAELNWAISKARSMEK